MSGVAERVEDGGDVIRDRIAESEGVVGRNRQVLGEGTRAVDADADGIAAQVAAAGTTVAAVTAGDVALARNAIALFQALHFRAELDDRSEERRVGKECGSRGARYD